MKKKLKDIMVMIPGKMKKHKKLTAALLVLFVLAGVSAGRLALTRKAKGGNQTRLRRPQRERSKRQWRAAVRWHLLPPRPSLFPVM